MARILVYILFILVAASCKEEFEAPGGAADKGYLVVEGTINNGIGPTTIRLSRTVPLVDTNVLRPERSAQVRVEGDDNSSALLYEIESGVYSADQLSLSDNVRYRLHIYTIDKKEYISDFAKGRKTPPINNITWERRTDGVELFVDTHDPQDTTRYYRWEYDETWEFKSYYTTNLWYVSNPSGYIVGVDYSTAAHAAEIYTCWASAKSSNILIGSSIKLSSDTVHLPILFVPQNAWKFSVLYSINVKQYSPSPAGFEFLQRMKKNTENLGSLFDAQPSQLVGNIHCVQDAEEPVIGFVDVVEVQQKRVFIKRSDVDPWSYREICDEEVSILNDADSINSVKDFLFPTRPAVLNLRGQIIRFFAASPGCVDCRTRGTSVKPSFWP